MQDWWIVVCSWVIAEDTFIFKWQTLIAGVLAFLAAAWTVRLLRRQISQAEGAERERRRASERAARAALIPIVEDLNIWTLSSGAILYQFYTEGELYSQANFTLKKAPTMDGLPDRVISSLPSFASQLETGLFPQAMTLVRLATLVSSRIRNLTDKTLRAGRVVEPVSELRMLLADCAALQVHCEAMQRCLAEDIIPATTLTQVDQGVLALYRFSVRSLGGGTQGGAPRDEILLMMRSGSLLPFGLVEEVERNPRLVASE
ncbi:hypothetical protein FDP22_10905 [Paroceanicella profunda]|uniref:Uncharacterized protein n=1 Tax=Paroceanicella profunda TaxID=2579971 RepID=A0A5B8FZV4_9RHOB|nr:hypothetical protein [Paroceanicella profunda]QDL92242.1 hypothetical protein FDP22_10905 [Paroceanicella profunda]